MFSQGQLGDIAVVGEALSYLLLWNNGQPKVHASRSDRFLPSVLSRCVFLDHHKDESAALRTLYVIENAFLCTYSFAKKNRRPVRFP